jgi:hypothetical protein
MHERSLFQIRGPSRFDVWSAADQDKLTFGRCAERAHHDSTYGGGSADGAILRYGFSSHTIHRSVPPDLPRLIGLSGFRLSFMRLDVLAPRVSRLYGFHGGSLDDDPGTRIFPECDEELARQRDDRPLARARAAALSDMLVEPTRQSRLRLML